MAEDKEYLDLDGLEEYHSKLNDEFKELTIEEIEEAFQDMDETDPLYSVVYELISKANEAAELAKESATSAAESLSKMAKPATHETDGLMSASDKVRLDEINDITTGINLLRGTRDFREGTEELILNNTKNVLDGFLNRGNKSFESYHKDEEGFTYLTLYNPSGSSSTTVDMNSNLVKVKEGDVFTISAEVMFDNYENWNSKISDFLIVRTITNDYATIDRKSSSQITLDSGNVPENNKWYKVKIFIEATKNSEWMEVVLRVYGNKHISFKKVKAEHGYINRPIYTVSPLDLSLEPVNDITTGINLLRGTRDFTLGKTIIPGTTQNRYFDGFRNDGDFTFFKDKEGFTVAEKTQSYDASKSLDIYVPYPEFDCKYTVSFEMFLSEDYSTANEVFVWFLNNKAGSILKAEYIAADKLGIVAGKWCKIVYSFSLSGITEPYDNCYLGIRTQITKAGTIRVRKMKLEKGHIEHPEWSASPFDTNGPTTGINLLRGTRDFIYGSTNVFDSYVYSDGFKVNSNTANISKSIDDDGFTILTINNPSVTTTAVFASVIVGHGGEKLTVNIDMKKDASVGDNVIVIQSMSSSYTPLLNEPIPASDLTTTFATYKKVVTIPVGTVFTRIVLRNASAGSVSFKKLGAYIGDIYNPEWSASPFDVAQQSDMLARTRYDVLNKVTASSNVTISTAIMRVNNVFAQLYIVATPKQTLTANTEYTFATLDSSIWPVLNAGLVGRVNGACGCVGYITSDSGAVRGAFPTNVDTSKSINLCATYLLNDKFTGASTLELPAGEVPVTLPTID